MRATNALLLCVGILLAAPTPAQQLHEVASPKGQVAAAVEAREQLNIVSTTDASEVADLLADFRARFPGIQTVYSKVNSNDIYNQIVDPASSGDAPGDVVWSSAMDLQIKLVNDGYAQPYVSKEMAHMPDWAIWKDEAYAITAEPIVIVYNKNLVAESADKSHDQKAGHLSRKDCVLRSGAKRIRIFVYNARCGDHQDDVGNGPRVWRRRHQALFNNWNHP
ncbi:ABC transporter substrate-binding protein [Bradyrhizobium sp.]|uniref:ABC transporter substrate-binding protein n=1 Tax=Bradyrhizobium sp. TaxID=376 RepID=UPI003C6F1148